MINKQLLHIGIIGPIYLPSFKSILNDYDENWPKGMGGVPVNHLISALINRGFKVSVFSNSTEIEKNKYFEYHQDNLSIYLGPYRKKARERILDFYKLERDYIKKSLLKENPDIINAHWQYEWALGALDSGIPTIVTCHDSPLKVLRFQFDIYRIFRVLIALIVIRKSKYLTTVSPQCENNLRVFSSVKFHIIPNFEPDYVFNLYKGEKKLESKPNIAMVNNGFSNLKNVKKGIEAFNILINENSNFTLNLFGNGYGLYQDAYNWCVKEKISLNNIVFHGNLEFPKLMYKLAEMDLLLHTSKLESFGMVIVEAMALGLPVIAGENSGGPEWIVKKGCGLLVDISNVNEIVYGINYIVSPKNYSDFSKIARENAEKRFSEKLVVNKYIDLYNLVFLNSDEKKLRI